ncbi:MAG TPA: hypothetical protein PK391_10865, partial [Syntrophales bacterium]|nr:hypothetical protein [Syntrophales bacterium]
GTIPIKIIDPGWGSSGYYSREVLQQAANARVYAAGLQMYWNHPSKTDEKERPERDLRDLAGVLTEDARWDEQGPKGPGLYSRAKVFSAYRDHVAEMGPYIGLSHYVWGESKQGEAEGKKGEIITRIVAARSVDFVTVPGRGGAIAEAFRAARPPVPTDDQKTEAGKSMVGEKPEKLTLESLRKDHPEIIEAVRKEIENSAAMKEAQAQQEKALKEAKTALEAAQAENARLKEAQLLVEAKTFVEAKVKDAKIPDLTKARIVESLGKSPVVKDGKLDEAAYTAAIEAAVKTEAEYLAKLGAGKIEGMGAGASGGQTKTLEETDKELVAGFMRLGMSEAEAKAAVKGA